MKVLSILMFIFLLANSFSQCEKERFSKIEFRYHFPVGYDDTMLFDFNIKFYKSNYKDVIIYQFPAVEVVHTYGKVLLDTLRLFYFIYKPGEMYGLKLDSLKVPITKENVDSMLKLFAVKDLNAAEVMPYLISSKKEEIDKDTFLIRSNITLPGYDSVFMYFNRKVRMPNFTLSHQLDSMYGAKLVKIRMLMSKNSSARADYYNNYRNAGYEFCEVIEGNLKEIETVYQRFKNEYNKGRIGY